VEAGKNTKNAADNSLLLDGLRLRVKKIHGHSLQAMPQMIIIMLILPDVPVLTACRFNN
jgi:hypothetical protein